MVHNLLEKIRYRIIHGGLHDTRYPEAAYYFIVAGVERIQLETGVKRHYTGRQLTLAFLSNASDFFGVMAPEVLAKWGITETKDFGNILYNCIDAGLIKKQESETIEDFDGIIGIDEYFNKKDDMYQDLDPEHIRTLD